MTSKEEIFDNVLKEIEEIKEVIFNQELKYSNIINFNLEDIKDSLIEAIKQDKILEILKNKQVNIHFDLVVKDTYEEYLTSVEGSKEYLILTKEEWNELKEWLNGKVKKN